MNLEALINHKDAVIVDVREPFEYQKGCVEGSHNIPLGQVPGRVEDFRNMGRPLVLICASGNRSGQAANFLKGQGLTEVYNGGGWYNVQQIKLQTV